MWKKDTTYFFLACGVTVYKLEFANDGCASLIGTLRIGQFDDALELLESWDTF